MKSEELAQTVSGKLLKLFIILPGRFIVTLPRHGKRIVRCRQIHPAFPVPGILSRPAIGICGKQKPAQRRGQIIVSRHARFPR